MRDFIIHISELRPAPSFSNCEFSTIVLTDIASEVLVTTDYQHLAQIHVYIYLLL
jgi:hypothetical protein